MSGKTVLITGAGSLIGEAIAQCLVQEGWRVIVTDVDMAKANLVADTLPDPDRVEVQRLDVTDPEEVESVFANIHRRSGSLGALVNAAGGGRGVGIMPRDFVDFTPEQRDRMLSLNLIGVLHCCRAALPPMIAAGRGGIVSITAARGLRGGPRASLYSAAKAGVIAFTQSLAQEVGPQGIRVNTVAPGNTAARWKTDPGPVRSPLGVPTTPLDVGNAVAFLLSGAAAHVTGSCVDVSGGTALH